jgi:hypothetical protein
VEITGEVEVLAMVHERTVLCDCPVGVVLLKMK